MVAKFPEVFVSLVGEEGNGALIIGRVMKAMRRAGIEQKEIDVFMEEAMSGDFDHLLQTVMKTVETG